MKVYVVTTGSYSDYCIDRIFTDRNKAEEYRKWCCGANDVEEYDTEDDFVFKKFYKIHIQYRVNDDGRNLEPKVSIHKCVDKQIFKNYTSVSDGHKWNGKYIELIMTRYVPAENWNEDFYRNKYVKAIYDFAAIARQKLFEGFTDREITDMFNDTYK